MSWFKRKPNRIVYMLLNDDDTLYRDKNGEYKIYKDIANLKDNVNKHNTRFYGVFELKEIKKYE